MPPRFRWLATALLGAALVAVPSLASAQHCPPMRGGALALGDTDASARLGYIQHRLRRGASRARIWAATWGSIYATVAAAQYARIPLSEDRNDRIQAGIAGTAALLGAGFLLVSPPRVIGDSRRLDRQAAQMRPGTAETCRVLADAERYLVRDAAAQAFGIGWLMQATTVVFNVGLGLVYGLALNDWRGGLIAMGTGIAVSEVMIFTQPTDAIDALRRYRAGDLRPTTATSTSYWIAAPDVGPTHAGLRVGAAF